MIDDGVGGTQLHQANYSFFEWCVEHARRPTEVATPFSGKNATVTLLFYGTRIDVYARKTAGSGITAFSVDNGGETTATYMRHATWTTSSPIARRCRWGFIP